MSALELPGETVRFGYRNYESGSFREAEGFGTIVWAGGQPVAVEVEPADPRREPVFIPWPQVLWLVADR
jgi:hypothetical protein